MSRTQDIKTIIQGAEWLTKDERHCQPSAPGHKTYRAATPGANFVNFGKVIHMEEFLDSAGKPRNFPTLNVLDYADEKSRQDRVSVDLASGAKPTKLCQGRYTMSAECFRELDDAVVRRMAQTVKAVMEANQ